MNARAVSIFVSALALLVMLAEVFNNDECLNLLLYLPFYAYPMLIAMFFSICSEKTKSQALLATGSVLYGVWYFLAVAGAFNILHNPGEEVGYMADLLNSVNYVLIGVYALPFMLAVWGVVGWFERRERPGFYKKPK